MVKIDSFPLRSSAKIREKLYLFIGRADKKPE
jgi:hypothetical protein